MTSDDPGHLRARPEPDHPSHHEPLRALLRELAFVPLLTAQEEQKLAFQWAQARHALEMRPKVGHSAGSVTDPYLVAGLLAREKLIVSNLRLVVSIARRSLVPGIALEDLVQEGTIGLIEAIDRFEPSLGYRLSTYATWWIRQVILRHLQEHSRVVRLPAHIAARIHDLRQATERLAQELQRIPTTSELAHFLGLKEEKLTTLLKGSQAPISLDDHGPDQDRPSPAETAVATQAEDPYEIAEAHSRDSELYSALRRLPERERRVIILRYGLPPAARCHNLEQIGRLLGVSGERVRQLERQALKRLRQMAGHALRAYLMAD